MTKDELTTRFKDLVSTNTNLDECNKFLADVTADYTQHETDATTLNTLNTRISDLTAANTALQQTNYQLFLQGLAKSNTTEPTKPDPDPDTDANQPSAEELTASVISSLKGEKK